MLSKRITGLARSLRPELKWYDVTNTDLAVYTTPGVVQLTPIVQGDTVNDRTGQKIKLKSIQFKGILRQTTGSDEAILCRIVILHDFDNRADPTWSSVYNADTIYSLRDLNVSDIDPKRFRIIYDRVFTLRRNTDEAERTRVSFKFYKKLKTDVEYISGNAGAGSGGLYLMVLGDTAQSTYIDLDYESRVRYTDVG